MAATGTTLSIRIPQKSRAALDQAAKATRRSRSFLVNEALDRHLTAIVAEQLPQPAKSKLALMMELKGAGAKFGPLRPAADIDAAIRAMRGDE